MIPLYRKIALSPVSSFSAVEEKPPLFSTPWHYHPEYELILILNSGGKRFMGDNISDFGKVELNLIGPNLPHFWTSRYSDEKNVHRNSNAYVIHFSENFLGKDFFNTPECKEISNFLSKSKNGLNFPVKKNDPVLDEIPCIVNSQGFHRVLHLLKVIEKLSKYDCKELSSGGFVKKFNVHQSERMIKVYDYILSNFTDKDISLKDVAEVANLSTHSFCRYIKKSTGKTFNHLLREIRIGHSCKLIIEDKYNITRIAYESGFNNISNFNRHFKSVMNMQPLEYKKHYLAGKDN